MCDAAKRESVNEEGDEDSVQYNRCRPRDLDWHPCLKGRYTSSLWKVCFANKKKMIDDLLRKNSEISRLPESSQPGPISGETYYISALILGALSRPGPPACLLILAKTDIGLASNPPSGRSQHKHQGQLDVAPFPFRGRLMKLRVYLCHFPSRQ